MITIGNDNSIKFVTKAEQSEKGISQAFREFGDALLNMRGRLFAKEAIMSKMFKHDLLNDIVEIEKNTTIKFIDDLMNTIDTQDILEYQSLLKSSITDKVLKDIYDTRVAKYKELNLISKFPFNKASNDQMFIGVGLVSTKRQIVYQRVVNGYLLEFFIVVDIGIRGKEKINELISLSDNSLTSDTYLSLAMRNYGARPTKVSNIPIGIRKNSENVEDRTVIVNPSDTKLVKLNISKEHFEDDTIGNRIKDTKDLIAKYS